MHCLCVHINISYFVSPAADTLNAIGFYLRDPLADYQPPVQYFNPIMNMVISEMNRAICYNQTIYDDIRVEEDEFFSLTLIVQDMSTKTTIVNPEYNTCVVTIMDDDSTLLLNANHASTYMLICINCTTA